DASGAQKACGVRVELPVPCTEAPPLQEKGPGARELLDASVAGVGDEDVPAAVHGDVNGVNELPVPRSLNPTPARGDACLADRHPVLYSPAEREEEGPVVGELLDAGVVDVGHVDVAASVHGDATEAPLELPISVAIATPLLEERPAPIELLDTVVAGVEHVD